MDNKPSTDTYWVPMCKYCGEKNDFQRCSIRGDFPPPAVPELKSLSCSKSPNHKHDVQWVRYR